MVEDEFPVYRGARSFGLWEGDVRAPVEFQPILIWFSPQFLNWSAFSCIKNCVVLLAHVKCLGERKLDAYTAHACQICINSDICWFARVEETLLCHVSCTLLALLLLGNAAFNWCHLCMIPEARRRKWLEDYPEATNTDEAVVFDTSVIPWWAWMKRFHLPEAEKLNGNILNSRHGGTIYS